MRPEMMEAHRGAHQHVQFLFSCVVQSLNQGLSLWFHQNSTVYIVQATKFCMITWRIKVVLFALLLAFNNNIKNMNNSLVIWVCFIFLFAMSLFGYLTQAVTLRDVIFNFLLLCWNISNLKNFQCPNWNKEG